MAFAEHWNPGLKCLKCQTRRRGRTLHILKLHAVSSLSSVFDISDISVLGFSAQQKPRKKGRELAEISLSPSEFSNTTCLSCDAAFINRTFDYTNRLVLERSIGYDCQSFGDRTFDCVRLAKFSCEFDYVWLSSAVEWLVFDWVWLPNCSIG